MLITYGLVLWFLSIIGWVTVGLWVRGLRTAQTQTLQAAGLLGLLSYLWGGSQGLGWLIRDPVLGVLGASVGGIWGSGGFEFQHWIVCACLIPTTVFWVLVLTRPEQESQRATLALACLVLFGLGFVYGEHLGWWLLSFELLVLVSLFLLRLTSKSERIADAATEMLYWALVGSLGLITAVLNLSLSGCSTFEQVLMTGGLTPLQAIFLIVGFGVKLPLWPCFSWLLKAHVEASVEFSILLSGAVVKFGVFGVARVLSFYAGAVVPQVVLACASLALFEATVRLLAQRDLKRIVALTTVVEMNWVAACLACGVWELEYVAGFLCVAHSITTTAEFLIVEFIYRRRQTRDVGGLSGLAYTSPHLFKMSFGHTLVTVGFPGTSLFVAKVLFLTTLLSLAPALWFFYAPLFLVVLPCLFMRVWVPVWFGQVRMGAEEWDLGGRETGLLGAMLVGSLLLGLAPGLLYPPA